METNLRTSVDNRFLKKYRVEVALFEERGDKEVVTAVAIHTDSPMDEDYLQVVRELQDVNSRAKT